MQQLQVADHHKGNMAGFGMSIL